MSGPGIYRIHSLVSPEHPVVGVLYHWPRDGGVGPAILTEPVHLHGGGDWKLTPANCGDNCYGFSIVDKFDYVGVAPSGPPGKIVVATNDKKIIEEAWYLDYIPHRKAYIIALAADKSQGWTVSDRDPESVVRIEPILVGLSEPPYYSPAQLFEFVKLDA